MKLKNVLRAFEVGFAPFLLLATPSCQTFEGEYTSASEARVIDDRWNETDAQQTSEALVSSMLKNLGCQFIKKPTKVGLLLFSMKLKTEQGNTLTQK